jgi:DNA-binding response OmpR family regulator
MQPRISVVLVEDDEDGREMLRTLLELDGHDVHTAWNGHTGLLLIRDRQPHLALIDLMLPGIDGFSIARTLREEHCRSLLVALSGHGREQDKRRALEAGFDGHFTKPAAPEDLAALVRRAAAHRA